MTTEHRTVRIEHPHRSFVVVGCSCGWSRSYSATRSWGWPVVREVAAQDEAKHGLGHGRAEGVQLHASRWERLCELCREFDAGWNARSSRSGTRRETLRRLDAGQHAQWVRVRGDVIGRMRKEAGLTQVGLARQAGVRARLPWELENENNGGDHFNPDGVVLVAIALGVSMKELLRGEGP